MNNFDKIRELYLAFMEQHGSKLTFMPKHSFRVLDYAKQIIGSDYAGLNEVIKTTIYFAAIFHDVGSIVNRKKHNEIGAEIVEEIKTDILQIAGDHIDFEMMKRLIIGHVHRKRETDDIPLMILIDADILDQIGAMSILELGSRYNYSDLNYFRDVIKHIGEKELPLREKEMRQLRCDKSKDILKGRIGFIRKFKNELEFEIKGEQHLR